MPAKVRPNIRIERIVRTKDGFTCSFSYDPALKAHFVSSVLNVDYDFPIDGIPDSVMSIPVLGLLVPVAWAAGADVTLGEVDGRYLSSLHKLAGVMKRSYPALKISTAVRCSEVNTPWPAGGNRDCLLYSGGVDSTVSMLRNLGPGLTLASVKGTPDLRLWENEYWDRVEDGLVPFIHGLGIERHVIETNAVDVVNLSELSESHKDSFTHGWWENLSHGLFLLSICAPYTYVGKVRRMMIASSFSRGMEEPWGSSPEADQNIEWGSVTTVHDSFDLSRMQKICDILAPYMTSHPGIVQLRVCTGERDKRFASGALNCGNCQKCLRTELGLMRGGVDPAECGFPAPDFSKFKEGLISGRLRTSNSYSLWAIHASKSPPKPELAEKYPGYSEFLSWFYGWELPRGRRRTRLLARLVPGGTRRRRLLDEMLH